MPSNNVWITEEELRKVVTSTLSLSDILKKLPPEKTTAQSMEIAHGGASYQLRPEGVQYLFDEGWIHIRRDEPLEPSSFMPSPSAFVERYGLKPPPHDFLDRE